MDGYDAINDIAFVKKVICQLTLSRNATDRSIWQSWEMCETGAYNLSHKSLSSPAIRQELNKIAQTAFYAEITSGKSQDAPPDHPNNGYEEDKLPVDDEDHNSEDISLSTRQVKKRTTRKTRRKG